MKKLFFLTALLCASVMANAAAVYTGTPFSGELSSYTYNIAYTITYNDDYSLTFTAEFTGTFSKTTGLVFEVWSSDLTDGHINFAKVDGNTWSVTDTKNFQSMEGQALSQLRLRIASQVGGTDQLYISAYTVGLDNTSADTEKPEMVSATLSSTEWNQATISVSATDNIAVSKYVVKNHSDASLVGEFTPSAGSITITGLSAETSYNWDIYAKDGADNISNNYINVEAITPAHVTSPASAAPVPTWPTDQVMSVYSDSYEVKSTWGYLEGWGQTTTKEEVNIDGLGNHVLVYSNFNYLGWGASTPYNVYTMEKLHLDIWTENNAQIGIVPIYGGPGLITDDSHRKVVNLIGGTWNSFDLDLENDFAGLNKTSIFQFKYDQGTMSKFYIDNVYFYRTTPLEDTQKPTDVTADSVSADYFSATLTVRATDNSGTVNYIVKNGETEVASGSGASAANTSITVSNLTPNTAYTFHVIASDVAGNEADPVAVTATTRTLPAAAPVPTALAENVKSLYSDTYDAATAVSDYRENWWNGANLIQTKLSANDSVLYYVAHTDGGAHGWAFDQFDATGFTKLHISIYPLAEGIIKIYPVVDGTTEADYLRTSEPLVADKWNELTFDFSGQALDKVKQLGWNSYYALGSFFIDNVYFYKDSTTGIDNTEVEAMTFKVIENGQLFIIKNGVRYNALGVEVR